jgi:hypothetical protein
MAPQTRGKGGPAANLLTLLNNSPAKKKIVEKKRKESECRAAEAAKKAETEKSAKAKKKKSAQNTDITDYTVYEKETAILLRQCDAQIAFNAEKLDRYSDLLLSFDHTKHPEAVDLIKAKVDKYSEYVDALRKGRAELLNSAKPGKGKKKTTVSDPLTLISSGESLSSYSQRSVTGPLPLPSFVRSFGTLTTQRPLSFFAFRFSFSFFSLIPFFHFFPLTPHHHARHRTISPSASHA